MNKTSFYAAFFLAVLITAKTTAQTKYDVTQLLADHQLLISPRSSATVLTDDSRKAVSVTGIAWLKGVNFSTGSIDVDLRGKNVFQQSFLGIAFHAVDTGRYEAVYFRPFNFRSPDTLRVKHAVQYMYEPDYPWDRLRKEHPLVYENAVSPAPVETDWFHAQIVVTADSITVYVNWSTIPSLKVKKLNNATSGMIGLWDDSLPGDFANLEIAEDK